MAVVLSEQRKMESQKKQQIFTACALQYQCSIYASSIGEEKICHLSTCWWQLWRKSSHTLWALHGSWLWPSRALCAEQLAHASQLLASRMYCLCGSHGEVEELVA